MSKGSTNDKLVFLKTLELLQKESDESNPMPSTRLLKRLKEEGYPCDRRTLVSNIALLGDYGIEAETTLNESDRRENCYFIASRHFSTTELRVIVDSLWAAGFIPDDQTEELAERVSALAGNPKVPITKMAVRNYRAKKPYKSTLSYIEELGMILQGNKGEYHKVSFKYFDPDLRGKKIYRNNGTYFTVSPQGLVINDGKYYLIAYPEGSGNLRAYRADRMEGVLESSETLPDYLCRQRRARVADYMKKAFGAWTGVEETVYFRCEAEDLGDIFDKFGSGLNIWKNTDDTLNFKAAVLISPKFYSWVTQFEGRLKITGPDNIKDDFKEFLKKAAG